MQARALDHGLAVLASVVWSRVESKPPTAIAANQKTGVRNSRATAIRSRPAGSLMALPHNILYLSLFFILARTSSCQDFTLRPGRHAALWTPLCNPIDQYLFPNQI
jgi:hypothetical protein